MGNQFAKVVSGYPRQVGRAAVAVALVCLVGSAVRPARAQSYLQNVGVPPFTTKLPVENGFINAANGNLHLEIPLGSFPQRAGTPDKIVLMYDSAVWLPVDDRGWEPVNISAADGSASWGGWRVVTSRDPGFVAAGEIDSGYCVAGDSYMWADYTPWIWTAPDGTQHSFPADTEAPYWPAYCPGTGVPSGSAYASDGSGYYISINNYNNATIYAPDGTKMASCDAVLGDCSASFYASEDSNGNYVPPRGYSFNDNVNTWTYLDTLRRTILTEQNTSGSNVYTFALPSAQNPYTVTLETINVNVNWGPSGFPGYSGTITVISEIDLPDGTAYTFGYDTPNSGLLTSMTLPTGGQISYSYSVLPDADHNPYVWVIGRTTPDGAWTYDNQIVGSGCPLGYSGYVDCQQQFTVTKPSGDQSVYTFTLNGGAWPTAVQYYTGTASSGTLLATTTQCFSFVSVTAGQCTYSTTQAAPATNVHLLAQQTALPIPGSNISTTTEYSWDNSNQGIYGELTQVSEWNFGNSPANSADRTTYIEYQSSANSSYLSANLLIQPEQISVPGVRWDWFSYDQSGLTSVTGEPGHDDSNYGTGTTIRGNLTARSRWTGSTWLTANADYDTTGEPVSSYDFNANQTMYDYSTCCYNSYPTTITNALNQPTHLGYDFNTGLLTSITDPNNLATGFGYDTMGRLNLTNYPSGGWTQSQFTNENQVDTYTGLTTNIPTTSCASVYLNPICRHDQTLLDGLGRTSSNLVLSDPDGQTTVTTQYDSNGRVQSVTNPYHSTSDSTYGTTQTSYDGLDRPTQITEQDNSAATTYYGTFVGSGGGLASQLCSGFGVGYPILYVDEAGKKRQTWTDGFGRIIEADEPDSNNNLTLGTCYSYDLNNNLRQIVQGAETRTYTYDAVSRLTSKTDPESGTTYYCYTALSGTACNGDSSTGSLCSGDPSQVCRRTGPAPNQTNPAVTVTTTYSYDALNRLYQKTYSDSTPPVYYSYDSCINVSPCYNIGRRTGMSDGSGSASFVYDQMGNVLSESETIANVQKTFSYTYNFDGSLKTVTYPTTGRVLTYSPSSAGRTTSLTDTTDSSHPIPYASNAHYSPFGALTSVQNGPSNILSTWSYNNRLQTCRMAVNSAGSAPGSCGDSNTGNIFDLAYNYNLGSDNGNLKIVSDNRTNMSGRGVSYNYDTLNRITKAWTNATSGSYCWAENFTFDRFGNLTQIAGQSDHPSCSQESLSLNATSQNRLSTGGGPDYGYDAAGNMISTPTPENAGFTYNAEGQLTQASDFGTAGYLYDGDGKRVAKTTAGTAYKLYWYGTNDSPLAESDGSGNITDEYIFLNGKRLAHRVIRGQ